MFSDRNTATTLSACTVMGYSTTTHRNNKIESTKNISKHTSVIAEYSSSITDSVTVLWIRKLHAMKNLLITMMYPVALFQVSLSPAYCASL